jgi:hypothetical protein
MEKASPPRQQLPSPLATVLSLSTTLSFLSCSAWILRSDNDALYAKKTLGRWKRRPRRRQQLPSPLATVLSLSTTLSFLSCSAWILRSDNDALYAEKTLGRWKRRPRRRQQLPSPLATVLSLSTTLSFLSSRPERSVGEGSAVRHSASHLPLDNHPLLISQPESHRTPLTVYRS